MVVLVIQTLHRLIILKNLSWLAGVNTFKRSWEVSLEGHCRGLIHRGEYASELSECALRHCTSLAIDGYRFV